MTYRVSQIREGAARESMRQVMAFTSWSGEGVNTYLIYLSRITVLMLDHTTHLVILLTLWLLWFGELHVAKDDTEVQRYT